MSLAPINLRDAHLAMRHALDLAKGAIGLSEPNPRVGCVLCDTAGRVLGRGFTQRAGGPHAEVIALRDAASRGEDLRGATAYVTLEPCSHRGRTPPCCDALIEAGISRIVAAVEDPNPLVAGQGLSRLRAAGVRVELGPLGDESRELNIGFFSRMQRQRPWVRLKTHVPLDGRTALSNGVSQWIADPAALSDGHAWRRRAGAVLTGLGSVLSDDPRLDVRRVETALQPLRVVVDSRLQILPAACILNVPGRLLIYAARNDVPGAAALRERGAEIAVFASPDGKVDLVAMLADLAARGINELHVEAGHRLSGSFVREGLVDEFLIYVAQRLFGTDGGMASLATLAQLEDGAGLRFTSVQRIGDNLCVLARPDKNRD